MVFASDQLDEIGIEGLEVSCFIGVYPRERLIKQSVIVNLRLFFDSRPSGRSDCLSDTISYEFLCQEISFVLENSRFSLLEAAGEALCRFLLLRDSNGRTIPIQEVWLELKKPWALGGKAIPSVRMFRRRKDLVGDGEFGNNLIYESSRNRLYQITLAGNSHRVIIPETGFEFGVMTQGSQASVNGEKLVPGQCAVYQKTIKLVIANHFQRPETILIVARKKEADIEGILEPPPRSCQLSAEQW